MSGDTKPVLCGECQIPLESGVKRDGEMWGVCSRCGQTDRMNEIMREAAKHFAHKSIGDMFKGLGRSGSGITVKRGPQPHFRWITGE
ncbi:hypothetical protein MKK69_02885 [Methylobacterium sp. J-026]|uniref:hypothetical protein n=1 Tax=Methylobacterium sp. J-026 TaxID=2836624 RepID=UPI001FB86A35|nr:hypothetical protein [Methylobacterium sp. J-026]MCJ2133021.1 hypothetical protein [Methylobacterium sp. J-026]